MDKEQSKKRKNSDKQTKKLKVAKVEVNEPAPPPLPPTPHDEAAPPLPDDSCIPLMLSPHHNEGGDGDMDMNSLLADHDIPPADGDVVLPTVPSLSDLMCQSDICGSIASSSDSSPVPESDGSAPPHDQCNGSTPASTCNGQVKQEIEKDLLDSAAGGGLTNTAQVKDSTMSANNNSTEEAPESTSEESREACQAELVEHAHALLDSTSNVKQEVKTEEEVANEEGYVLRKRQLVRDIVPSCQYEVLPEGWKELTHASGLSIYCHLPTRVVTWARPYSLADRYAKTHDVPVGAIPCMVYRRCKELYGKKGGNMVESLTAMEVQSTDNTPSTEQQSTNTGANPQDTVVDGVVIKAEPGEVKKEPENVVPTVHKFPPLDAEVLTEYCKSVFDFDQKEIKQFKDWRLRKEHDKKMKEHNKLSAATKEGTSRIVIPVTELPEENQRDERGKLKRDFIVIFGTQTVVDIFHHYSTWMWRKPPAVEIKPLDQGFQCNVRSKDLCSIFGTGIGHTKKLAKENAAMCALQVLIPKYADKLIENALCYGDKEKTQVGLEEYYKIFNSMSIKDERVVEVSKDTNQVYPYVILKSCLARNFAMTESDIQMKTCMERRSGRTGILCDMTVGNCSVKGARGKNTKMAMHAAAQDILQQLHPTLSNWGSILRLYGKFSDGSSEDLQHRSAHQSEVTELQTVRYAEGESKSAVNPLDEVSDVVLKKLRKQMTRIFKYRKDKVELLGKKKFDHGEVEPPASVPDDQTLVSNQLPDSNELTDSNELPDSNELTDSNELPDRNELPADIPPLVIDELATDS